MDELPNISIEEFEKVQQALQRQALQNQAIHKHPYAPYRSPPLQSQKSVTQQIEDRYNQLINQEARALRGFRQYTDNEVLKPEPKPEPAPEVKPTATPDIDERPLKL